jgi:hypothetical protein
MFRSFGRSERDALCNDLHADAASVAEERRKRHRRKYLAALLLFTPWKKLRTQIAVATHDFEGYFDAVDAALETGALSTALKSGVSTVGPLTRLIRASMIGGYQDGGTMIGISPGSRYEARALREAQSRAAEVSSQMLKTSKKWLKADPSNEFALSSARAERAARFEAAKGYYTGLHQALWGHGMMKEWVCLGDDPCDDICVLDEDDGKIPLEEMFSSGDFAPLGHLGCLCVLSVSRGEGL